MTQHILTPHPTQEPVRANEPGRKLKFDGGNGFQAALRAKVDAYFRSTGKRERDCWQMYLKTAILFTIFASSYVLLVFVAQAWWQALPLVFLLGLTAVGIAFNVQHDGGHHAYSKYPWINKLMAMSLDLLGASSYVWARKHNSIHHTYSNITHEDDDINIGFLGRLSPHQARLKIHRWQHFYLWPLYGFLPVKWQLYDDFQNVAVGRIGTHRLARPKGWDLATFLGGKALFFALAFGIPLMLHPVWAVLLCYLATSFVQGLVMSVVFQLAHCVEEAEFPMPKEDTGRMETPWAIHQVETTVDFARGNRLLSWCVGGLSYQIEHHLFPQICHVNYPALSKLVEETCREFGVRYREHRSLWAGLVSHYRWLRQMGTPVQASNS